MTADLHSHALPRVTLLAAIILAAVVWSSGRMPAAAAGFSTSTTVSPASVAGGGTASITAQVWTSAEGQGNRPLRENGHLAEPRQILGRLYYHLKRSNVSITENISYSALDLALQTFHQAMSPRGMAPPTITPVAKVMPGGGDARSLRYTHHAHIECGIFSVRTPTPRRGRNPSDYAILEAAACQQIKGPTLSNSSLRSGLGAKSCP
jgi:hypothetical protein